MAIDPVRLVQQQQAVRQTEYLCPGCGRRTRDKEGRCVNCRKAGVGNIDWPRLSLGQLGELSKAIRCELKRRQDEIASAMGES